MIVFIQSDFEVTDNMISVLFNHLNQCMNRGIQIVIFHLTTFIHILDGYRMCQFIIGKQVSVLVIYTPAASCYCTLLFNFHLKRINIVLSMHNLEFKHTMNHYRSNSNHNDHQQEFP